MASILTIPCPHCHTLNRVPSERRGEGGKCGQCHKRLFAGHPINLDAAHFDRHAGAADLPLLVDFWAAWCGPCRAVAPAVDDVAKEYKGKLKVGKLDIDNHQRVPQQLGIRSIPTLMIFKGGKVVETIVGAVPKAKLVESINKVL